MMKNMGTAARRPRNMVFAVDGRDVVFEFPQELGLDLLDWLGLGRPAFGAIEVAVLLPLCRRRLWLEARNDGLRHVVGRFARGLEKHARNACVHFG